MLLRLFAAQKGALAGGILNAVSATATNAATQASNASAAAGAALNAFNKELLASHIRTCVVEDIRDGKDEVIDELVATLQKLMK